MNAIAQAVIRQETLPHIRPRTTAPFRESATEIVASGATDRGLVRERNEDQFLVAKLTRAMWVRQCGVEGFQPHMVSSPQGTLLAVADGIGGHSGGDLASAVALDALTNYISSVLPWSDPHFSGEAATLEETLKNAVRHCQERVVEASCRKQLTQSKPGTTLTMAYVVGDIAYLVHAGDSRAYLLRESDFTQLTVDHTLAQEMADFGTPPDELDSPFHHVLSNAIGAGVSELRADVKRVPLDRGDVLLLCTDGLTRHISDDELRLALGAEPNPKRAADTLIETAKRRGGKDNITAIVARFEDNR